LRDHSFIVRTFSTATLTARAAAALAALALTLAALTVPYGAGVAVADGPILAIDAGIEGNQPLAIGTIENCIAVKTGDEFQMDIVVENITNLLAWEIYLDYNPAVVIVIDENVKLFQQANAGSSVLDISGRVPDDSGLHYLAAFDSSDPPTPDSGTGVLARVSFRAVGAGESPVNFSNRDINLDGIPDKATLLRDSNTDPIGDSNADKHFDGEQDGAVVDVDQACSPDARVAPSPPGDSASGGSFPWLIASVVAAAVIAISGAGAFVLMSRRHAARRTVPDEPS
jgi:hypothetical protein